MMTAFLEISNLTKRYGSVTAISNLSLTVGLGRFLTLLGPSGSGKTTVLMAIAGFVAPNEGTVRVNGNDVTQYPPEKRNFGMVFQGYALFPHLSVFENVAFSLQVRRRARAEVAISVKRALDMVQLTQLSNRMPKQLSGGQQQRVAIARALAFEPDLVLLDEPMSALDKKLRAEMQEELRVLHRRVGKTFVCVTHDQEEALSLSDEIAVLRDGKLEQVGAPKILYERPRTRFVADFLGGSSFLHGSVVTVAGSMFTYRCGNHTFVQAITQAIPNPGDPVLIALRSERVRICLDPAEQEPNRVQGKIVSTNYKGAILNVAVETDLGITVSVSVPSWWAGRPLEPGAPILLNWAPEATTVVQDE